MTVRQVMVVTSASALVVAVFLGLRFYSKYQTAVQNESEMRGLTESLLRLNRDELSRDALVRSKLNALKERRELIAASRRERSDGMTRPCSTDGLFTVHTEMPLIAYDNYLNAKNEIHSFRNRDTGKLLRPDEVFEEFKEAESSSRDWLMKSARACAWGYGGIEADSFGSRLKFFLG